MVGKLTLAVQTDDLTLGGVAKFLANFLVRQHPWTHRYLRPNAQIVAAVEFEAAVAKIKHSKERELIPTERQAVQ
jgi:hypothetical protein